ncbi:potassium transporter [[Haemophilus] ducreyi]|uniref:Glutathione-regulated potassium-efflux system protein n=2 Tax=Haemophilus ducreyi TaxID=730 RepID=Q7VND6_HAEDU|nr:monovalent cation:proton antiporter-2 (CPA2) family protein [[Haemophilus] ducreyi]AAP95544.1 glutathione-regulated potassium-efflux system protein [[Haemophilus] ducreyi 35000HP]AKO30626.1 potassium transporter [[Haemophilus] ducreyi]AKO32063.1 potassium transporter [[Haemophilus] ducreyi]AKO34965.1 potassium transporter [[Haemophilus] ducreyi]AKO36399.1 potassium transporter [[Haemophilus] ducreyi]
MSVDIVHLADSELGKIVALLATSITIVPLFKRLGLGSVLGYLVAGCLIGPSVLGLFQNPQSIVHMAELGVVMFLFIIGLEMHPELLWSMRKAIFGRGFLQVLTCGTLLTFAGIHLIGLTTAVAFVVGAGFTLSSTAIVMQVLEDKGISSAPKGQRIVSTLLFEDLAIVPLLASMTFLAPSTEGATTGINSAAISIAVIGIIILVASSKWIMNPLFRMISKAKVREMMTAAALLVVLGAALLMELSGLSMAMGAFVAGVMLSESSFRHQLEADIEPFRGLLLGLFFMGVGMSLDLKFVFDDLFLLLSLVVILVLGKAISVYVIGLLTLLSHREALMRMSIMSHGGEFAFVLFSAAAAVGILDEDQQATFTAAVIISMLLSPLVVLMVQRIMTRKAKPEAPSMAGIEVAEDLENSVIVIGFGRFSQIVCQILLARGITVTVIDANTDRIRAAARFGFKVYYGDGTRLDVLRASGLAKADCVVLGINDPTRSASIVEQIKHEFPLMPIFARTYDRYSAIQLTKLHVDFQIRETFESALVLSKATMMKLGIDEVEALEVIESVRVLDKERFKEELIYGTSAELIRKYFTPKPLVKPQQPAEALNEYAAEILAETDESQHCQDNLNKKADV